MLIQKVWGVFGVFVLFCFGNCPTLSSPPSHSPNSQPNEHCFSCFGQSLLKRLMCVPDKYTPVATCKRNKPQHENTKASFFSYVNKSPDGSFVRLCLLILVFFLDNLFPVTLLSLKLEVMLTISFNEKSVRRCGLKGWRDSHTTHTHTHTYNSQEGLTILGGVIVVGREIFLIRVRRE